MSVRFYNSRGPHDELFSLKDVVLKGQADNGGLFVPEKIPEASIDLIRALHQMSEAEIVEELSNLWLDDSVSKLTSASIARNAISFYAPLVGLGAKDYILELFHGPTLAFKDYGARFLARLLSHYLAQDEQRQTILVATSGDTGSAAASGFLGLDNIDVVVLYPKGRVSDLQERQMTTLGQNVSALEVEGSFDDCQSLVKQAFSDAELKGEMSLNSANSINFARLIGQTFYYFIAYAQLERDDENPVFCVPSGNLGNLTSGLMAKRMGLPIHHLVSATNENDVFVKFLESGKVPHQHSKQTLSSAMDVIRPSNLERLRAFFNDDLLAMKKEISAYRCSDDRTKEVMKAVSKNGYTLDPHTAVAVNAISLWRKDSGEAQRPCIALSTAHPAKFAKEVENATQSKLSLPDSLADLLDLQKVTTPMQNDFQSFKKWLLEFKNSAKP